MSHCINNEVSKEIEELPVECTKQRSNSNTDIAKIACLPFADMEAALADVFDQVQNLSDRDPLAGLDAAVSAMLAIDTEILKASAPTFLENSQLRAVEFARTGKVPDVGRGETRALTSFLKLQQEMAKLGAARVKIQDEIELRGKRSMVVD